MKMKESQRKNKLLSLLNQTEKEQSNQRTQRNPEKI